MFNDDFSVWSCNAYEEMIARGQRRNNKVLTIMVFVVGSGRACRVQKLKFISTYSCAVRVLPCNEKRDLRSLVDSDVAERVRDTKKRYFRCVSERARISHNHNYERLTYSKALADFFDLRFSKNS